MRSAAAPLQAAPGTRRERRRQEVRGRIIDAAMQLFDAKGFAATTVGQICTAADVAEKTFFNHFTSKPDMLREVARIELDLLLGMIAEAARLGAGGDAGTRVEHFFRLLADRVEGAGPMRRELLTELVHLAHDAGTGSMQARTLHGAFAALLRGGRGGPVRGLAVETAVEAVLGGFYALMLNWANIEGYPVRRRALAMARFLGDAVAHAARRKR